MSPSSNQSQPDAHRNDGAITDDVHTNFALKDSYFIDLIDTIALHLSLNRGEQIL